MTEVSRETGLLRSLASELEGADVKGSLKPCHEEMNMASEAWPAFSSWMGSSEQAHIDLSETVGDAIGAVDEAITGLGKALSAVVDHYVDVETSNTVG